MIMMKEKPVQISNVEQLLNSKKNSVVINIATPNNDRAEEITVLFGAKPENKNLVPLERLMKNACFKRSKNDYTPQEWTIIVRTPHVPVDVATAMVQDFHSLGLDCQLLQLQNNGNSTPKSST